MGGRGASSGISKYGNRYGSQYRTVASKSNIKVIKPKVKRPEVVMETKTSGRVYGVLNNHNILSYVVYFDKENKRKKIIDLGHAHYGMKPHTHHGYLHNENDGDKGATKLTCKEKKMVRRINGMIE